MNVLKTDDTLMVSTRGRLVAVKLSGRSLAARIAGVRGVLAGLRGIGPRNVNR